MTVIKKIKINICAITSEYVIEARKQLNVSLDDGKPYPYEDITSSIQQQLYDQYKSQGAKKVVVLTQQMGWKTFSVRG